MATTTVELTWLSFILRDIEIGQSQPALLFCDNVTAFHRTVKPKLHARTKDIELDYHFVLEKVVLGLLVTWFISSQEQLTDIFTKPLPQRISGHMYQTWFVDQSTTPFEGYVENKAGPGPADPHDPSGPSYDAQV
ncbi:hypothetical protein NE237_024747 [Protea cynaroides]|uniref:Uncharacterized protein n=1 Tax=Protea cynaroides TaxID=273540 RepID=A0A9Q0H0H1_9MAGN|nr:hypothetical protein NE237_024747 [Protea cynaroides]